MKNLQFADLDLEPVPDFIGSNQIWLRCMELALRSRSENQRYGALVINEHVLGEGWNRLLGREEFFPFPTSFFLHAEGAAIGNAILRHGLAQIRGAVVYVAGFVVETRRPLIRRKTMLDKGSCSQCAKLYLKFGLSVAFPSEVGWVIHNASQACQNATTNTSAINRAGISKRQFRESVCL